METKRSLPCSQNPENISYPKPYKFYLYSNIYWRCILIFFFYLRVGISSGVSFQVFKRKFYEHVSFHPYLLLCSSHPPLCNMPLQEAINNLHYNIQIYFCNHKIMINILRYTCTNLRNAVLKGEVLCVKREWNYMPLKYANYSGEMMKCTPVCRTFKKQISLTSWPPEVRLWIEKKYFGVSRKLSTFQRLMTNLTARGLINDKTQQRRWKCSIITSDYQLFFERWALTACCLIRRN